MAKKSGLRVYVLGAGCSYDEQHGYPLAKGFLRELKSYANKIHKRADCPRIEKSVQQTIELLKHYQFGQYQASTIDQLVNLILRKQSDDYLRAMNSRVPNRIYVEDVALRFDAVFNAQIATSACFLEKEERVIDRLLPKYQAFIRKIFNESGVSTPCSARLRNSNARVFSFNYDRLFELAFFGAGFVDDYLKSVDPYSPEVLNSGLNAEIVKDRFCLIKLHGSIGLRCREQTIYRDIEVANWKPPKVTDEMFFGSSVPGQLRDAPLIVFPYDKDFILSKKPNEIPCRDYISKIWNHAKNSFREALEIFIIGYSFSDPMDSKYLIDCIREAKNCRQIEIQNSRDECDRIGRSLDDEHGIQVPIKKNTLKF